MKCLSYLIKLLRRRKMDRPVEDIDYVVLFSNKLKEDSRFFKDHTKFINSQIRLSRELFKRRFGEGDEFKRNARDYLGKICLI
jgi:hypothetical protein